MKQEDLGNLLAAIIELEHETKRQVSAEQYRAMFNLACAVKGTPDFIAKYFARKMNTAK